MAMDGEAPIGETSSLSVTNAGARAVVIVNGVEFRALEPGAAANAWMLQLEYTSVNAFHLEAANKVVRAEFSGPHQTNVVNIFNNARNTFAVAKIIQVLESNNHWSNWGITKVGDAGRAINTFSGGTDAVDLGVTIGNTDDTTASGYLDVENAVGDLIFGADTDTNAAVTGSGDARKVTYTGTYGTLVVDSDGDWVYTLNADTTVTQAETETFTVTIIDTGADNTLGTADDQSLTHQIAVTVMPMVLPNPVPTVANGGIDDVTFDEGSTDTLDIRTAFADTPEDTLTFTATVDDGSGNQIALPSWISFDGATGVFTLNNPDDSEVGDHTITVTATDTRDQSVSDTFTLTLNNVNDAPEIGIAIDDQTVEAGADFSLTVAAFTDADGDMLTYTATLEDGTALPDWLVFDAATRMFTATSVPADAVGSITVKVTASDGTLAASDAFILTINEQNQPPVVTYATDQQTDGQAEVTEDDSATAINGVIRFSDPNIHDPASSLVLTIAHSYFNIRDYGYPAYPTGENAPVSTTADGETPADVIGQYGVFTFSRNDETGELTWNYILANRDATHEGITNAMKDRVQALSEFNNGNPHLVEDKLTISVSDGPSTSEEEITVSVTVKGVDDPPVITFVETMPPSFAENTLIEAQTSFQAIRANDPDDRTVTFRLKPNNNDDAGLFFINSRSGEVLFLNEVIPDFEAKPFYTFTVLVKNKDGEADLEETFTIHVTNVEEFATAMTVSILKAYLSENTDTSQRVKIADLSSDDPEGNAVFQIIGQNDYFEIEGNEVFLKAGTALDHQARSSLDMIIGIEGTEITETFSVNILPPSMVVSDKGGRASVVVNGVEFRALEIGAESNDLLLSFGGGTANGVDHFGNVFLLEIIVSPGETSFTPAAVAAIWNADMDSNTVAKATVITPPAEGVTWKLTDWVELGELGFSGGTAQPDYTVTEDDPDDTTARGYLSVVNNLGEILFGSDTDTGATVSGTGKIRKVSYEGSYGTLVLNAEGDWIYMLDQARAAALNPDETVMETFTVTLKDLGDEQNSIRATSSHIITVTVVGADSYAALISLTNSVDEVDENSDTSAGIKIADIVLTDPDGGLFGTLELAGVDREKFELRGDATAGFELWLARNVALDHEDTASLSVRAQIMESPETGVDHILMVGDVEEIATALMFNNPLLSISESSDVTQRIKLADLSSNDPEGNAVFKIVGESNFFEIEGTELFLKAGADLDYETVSSLSVGVTIEGAETVQEVFTIAVGDDDDFATAIELRNPVTNIDEFDRAGHRQIKLTDFEIIDPDGGRIGTVELAGPYKRFFEISGNSVYIVFGAQFNFESLTKFEYSYRLQIKEKPSIGVDHSFIINDVNETPPVFNSPDVIDPVDENVLIAAGTVIATVSATPEVEGYAIQWSLSDDNDGKFAIDQNGVVTVVEDFTPDFEASRGFYSFRAVAKAGSQTAGQTVFLIVNDRDDPADFIFTASAPSVAENLKQEYLISTILIMDEDTTTFEASAFSVDDDRFVIKKNDAGILALYLKSGQPIDFETEPRISLTATLTNGEFTITKEIEVTVTDANDYPTINVISQHLSLKEDTDADPPSGKIRFSDVDSADSQASLRVFGSSYTLPESPPSTPSRDDIFLQEITRTANTTFSIFPASSDTRSYGSIDITREEDGSLSWVLDTSSSQAQNSLNRLAEGQIINLFFHVRAYDSRGGFSDVESVKLTVEGTNDAPVVSVTTSTDQIIDTEFSANNMPSLTGRITVTDVDDLDDHVFSIASGSGLKGGIVTGNADTGYIVHHRDTLWGRIDLDAETGEFTFTVNAEALNSLDEGEAFSIQLTARVSDGHETASKTFSFTLLGAEDTPPISVTTVGARAFVEVNGVMFRALNPGDAANGWSLKFKSTEQGGLISLNDPIFTIGFDSAGEKPDAVPAGFATPEEAALYWNSKADGVAWIIDMLSLPDTNAERLATWTGGEPHAFKGGTAAADLMVTEDNPDDATASGYFAVTDALGEILFGGAPGDTAAVVAGSGDLRTVTYQGDHGTLVITAHGDWVYTLNDAPNIRENVDDIFTISITDLGVKMDDASDDRYFTHSLTVTVNADDDVASVVLNNLLDAIDEGSDASTGIKIADIGLIDLDGGNPGTLQLAGEDRDKFEFRGDSTEGFTLWLKAGTVLNYDIAQSFSVRVQIEEAPMIGADHVLAINDVDYQATMLTISQTKTSISELADTSQPVKIADLMSDDPEGNEVYELTRPSAHFSIVGSEVFLNAAALLDHETAPSLSVDIRIVGTEITETITLAVENVDSFNQGARAFAVVHGVEFRSLNPGEAGNDWELEFKGGLEGVRQLGDRFILRLEVSDTATYTPADIVAIWNANTDISSIAVASVTGETSPPDGTSWKITDWTELALINFDLGSTSSDLIITETDPNDHTASGYIAFDDPVGAIIYGSESDMNAVVTGTGEARKITYQGVYGELVIGNLGDWVYTFNSEGPAHVNFQEAFIVILTDTGVVGDDAVISHSITIQVHGTDAYATAVALGANPVTSLAENSNGQRIADLVITDADGDSPGFFELAGTHAGLFEIRGDTASGYTLWLVDNAMLDHESMGSIGVRVQFTHDDSLGVDHAITVTNVDEAATEIIIEQMVMSLPENTQSPDPVKIADLRSDDPENNAVFELVSESRFFEIVGSEVFLKAETVLDHETASSLSVDIRIMGTELIKTVTLTVDDVNEAPSVVGQMPNQTFMEGSTESFELPEGLFADLDNNDSLTYTATVDDGSGNQIALPLWISFDGTGFTLNSPDDAHLGDHVIRITATDTAGNQATYDFTLTINNINDQPIARPSTKTVDETMPATFMASDFIFEDDDSGDSLKSVTIISLPDATDGQLLFGDNAVTEGQVIMRDDLASLKFIPANKKLSYTATFDFKVSDGQTESLDAATMTIEVAVFDDMPVLTAIGQIARLSDDPVVLTRDHINATDADTAITSLTFRVTKMTHLGLLQRWDATANGGEGDWINLNDDGSARFNLLDIDRGLLRVAGSNNGSFSLVVSDLSSTSSPVRISVSILQEVEVKTTETGQGATIDLTQTEQELKTAEQELEMLREEFENLPSEDPMRETKKAALETKEQEVESKRQELETPHKVVLGIGKDDVKTGSGNDEVDPGMEDDKVDLNLGGQDKVTYRFAEDDQGNLMAWDGGDTINGFTPGEDTIQLGSRSDAVKTLEAFTDKLDEDYKVMFDFEYKGGGLDMMALASYDVTGIWILFAEAVLLPGGKLTGSILTVNFEDSIDWIVFKATWLAGDAYDETTHILKGNADGKSALANILGISLVDDDSRNMAIGQDGDDTITITDDSGDWVIDGSGGDDTITLSDGAEELVYMLADDGSTITPDDGSDIITGFELGMDMLRFVDSMGDTASLDDLLGRMTSVALSFDGSDYTGIIFTMGAESLNIAFSDGLDAAALKTALGDLDDAGLTAALTGGKPSSAGDVLLTTAGLGLVDDLFGADNLIVSDTLPVELI